MEVKAPQPTKQEMQKPEAPKVLSPLQPTQANEGSPVLLQASIVGKPTPNVSEMVYLLFTHFQFVFAFILVHMVERW